MANCISKKASRRLSRLALVIQRDNSACVWCSKPLSATHQEATIEHLVPLSLGGEDKVENMLLACGPCNHSRQSVLALDWLEYCQDNGLTAQIEIVTAALARA
jgi:hypothetical protein